MSAWGRGCRNEPLLSSASWIRFFLDLGWSKNEEGKKKWRSSCKSNVKSNGRKSWNVRKRWNKEKTRDGKLVTFLACVRVVNSKINICHGTYREMERQRYLEWEKQRIQDLKIRLKNETEIVTVMREKDATLNTEYQALVGIYILMLNVSFY